METQNPAQRKRLLVALALSALILIGFDVVGKAYFGFGVMGPDAAQVAEKANIEKEAGTEITGTIAAQGGAESALMGTGTTSATAVVRLPLENEHVKAEVALTGGRVDTLVLKDFAATLGGDKGYELMKPQGTHAEYMAGGWIGAGIEGPGDAAQWQVEADLQAANRVVLVWRNASGQAFQRTFELKPDSYTVSVTEKVVNGAELPVSLTPYVQLHRADGDLTNEHSTWVNYFGPMGLVGEVSEETSFKNLKSDGSGPKHEATGGWWGITSQYFMAAIVPGEAKTERQFRYAEVDGRGFYSASVQWPAVVVPAGGNHELTYALYAGPKHEAELVAAGAGLERAIDWGWFKAIARPFYHALVWLHGMLWNSWALAVITLTLLLKIATFPLANKSYHAMAKMKKLQPRMEELKVRYKDDQQGMAMAVMEMYRKEKVNPMSGCWPMLIQIPIFFAMYKAVLVAFEFRHAPLAGWIPDMSAADPYFVLPVLMGISMFVQFRLNPPPADPVQAAMFKWMPVFMTIMFLWFPAGLVLYWVTNNVFSIAQQAFIMRRDKAI